ncbi:MAG: transcription elongation factor GreA [Candidatus Levybacteria bacterium CG10_big_fil_rev_8_21_14_0_10_36_7]|nr:MAG: transcription elongation factor GreA [Candidatus Levybacteria bacterium CG10_big_fil_rev_8_21_14_0_10_36_7]
MNQRKLKIASLLRMRNNRIHFTKEGFEKIQKEYDEILASRKAAVATLSEARAMGDLSENGLYTAAKGRLRGIDSSLRRLKNQIKRAEITTPPKDIVGIGSKVVVSDGKTEREFTIVGATEANPGENHISEYSPIGKTLLGKKAGDKAQIQTPSGIKIFEVKKIS